MQVNLFQKVSGFCLLAGLSVSLADAQAPQRVWSVPRAGTFWSMQLTNRPPMPFLPSYLPQNTPVYLLSTNGSYIYDDSAVDYPALNAVLASVPYPPGPGDGEYGGSDTNTYPPSTQQWGTNDVWLEIQRRTNDASIVDLLLHGATNGYYYQWLASRTPVEIFPAVPPWTPGQVIQCGLTNTIYFDPITVSGMMRFFRAAGGDTVVSIVSDTYQPTVSEPCSTNGDPPFTTFTINLNPSVARSLTVLYSIGGSASNGTDYTNLTGTVVVPSGAERAQFSLYPKPDAEVEFEESVVLTLIMTNGYLLDPAHYSASVWIEDCSNDWFTVVATNVPAPASIDFHTRSNALLIGVNFDTGETNNFALVSTNNLVENWSGVHGVIGELKFATVRDGSATLTNGDSYFGTGNAGEIGWLSWDGAVSNLSWCQFSNETEPINSLYVDRTGIWSNDLLAVTAAPGGNGMSAPGIWRIHSQTNFEQVLRIPTFYLEGLLTVPNNTNLYGPWAGKLLTGDENERVIYAVDPNGEYRTYPLDIEPDGFHLVEEGQAIYCVNFLDGDPLRSRVLKISANLLTGFAGDILITQAGEVFPYYAPKLFFVRWDPEKQEFITRRISLPSELGGHFEGATLAPIEIPDL